MALRKTDFPLSLHVLVEKEGSRYFAHILELDLITEAASRTALQKAVRELVDAHVKYAVEHNALSNLFRPAPLEYWQKYSKGISKSRIKPKERTFNISLV